MNPTLGFHKENTANDPAWKSTVLQGMSDKAAQECRSPPNWGISGFDHQRQLKKKNTTSVEALDVPRPFFRTCEQCRFGMIDYTEDISPMGCCCPSEDQSAQGSG